MSLQALARFARSRPMVERCDLCAVELGAVHDHLLDDAAMLRCACTACAPLMEAKWKRVRRAIARAAPITDAAWAALDVPVALAFVVVTASGPVVRFPSPAGLTQGSPPATAWAQLAIDLVPEVEALLIDRRTSTSTRTRTGTSTTTWRVSIDVCYELVAVLRARGDVDAFFAQLEARC